MKIGKTHRLLGTTLAILVLTMSILCSQSVSNLQAKTTDYYDIAQAVQKEWISQRPSPYGYLTRGILMLGLAAALMVLFRKGRRSQPSLFEPVLPASPAPEPQRRAWLRVDTDLEVRYSLIIAGKIDENIGFKKAQLKDISGGGCSLVTSQELKVGDKLKLFLELIPEKNTEVTAQVRRIIDHKDAPSSKLFGLEFINLTEREKDLIASWVINRQRELIEEAKHPKDQRCLRCGNPLPAEVMGKQLLCPSCVLIGKDD